MKKLTRDERYPNNDEERWVRCDWRSVFFFSKNEI